MKRTRFLLWLALGATWACGDDDGTDDREDAGSGVVTTPDAGMDAATRLPKVINVGAECTGATMCSGSAAQCATSTPTNVIFPNGYCTSSCLRREDCGPDGDCPLGELIASLPLGDKRTLGLTAGQCWDQCDTPGGQSSCRNGYVCTTLGAVWSESGGEALFARPVCLPSAALDAGVVDASTPQDASTVDASGLDAATSL